MKKISKIKIYMQVKYVRQGRVHHYEKNGWDKMAEIMQIIIQCGDQNRENKEKIKYQIFTYLA